MRYRYSVKKWVSAKKEESKLTSELGYQRSCGGPLRLCSRERDTASQRVPGKWRRCQRYGCGEEHHPASHSRACGRHCHCSERNPSREEETRWLRAYSTSWLWHLACK